VTIFLVGLTVLMLAVVALQLVLLFRRSGSGVEDLKAKLEVLQAAQERLEKALRDEMAVNRGEVSNTLTNMIGLNTQNINKVREVLESVHKGLGEMQNLASSVGDLKKVLTNVKTRGTWGEVQLAALLEQMLTIDQYSANVATKKNSQERVEFAIKLPGREEDKEKVVWLPIDAKFPQEDYQRLIEAQEAANPELAEKCGKQLELRVKSEARDIRDKYLNPPQTTDFGIMFLPSESLFAEVLRRPGLCESLQREFRVTVAGPTTLAAFLNSLQMGFRTLVIEKRSSEVWRILSAVKQEFSRFGEILERTKKKLEEAANIVEEASSKSRNIEAKLRKVQELPDALPQIDAEPFDNSTHP